MFDIETLRFTLGALSIVVLSLFYTGVYRPTRSPFAGWWTFALLCSAMSPALLLLNGTDAQVIANPASSFFTVVGGVCVWFATRSLRGLTPVRWVVYVAPSTVAVVALLDNPSENKWAGNGLLFAMMALFFSLGARDIWMAWYARRQSPQWAHDGEARVALMVSALAATLLSAFYFSRTVLYFSAGPTSDLFTGLVGTGPATVVLLVTLVAVTFSVAALGYDEQTRELRRRVALDDLTGLLARTAFFDRVAATITKPCSSGQDRLFVVADLDHFKTINDLHGHAAGDRALEVFASVVSDSLDDGELAGRLGGEEFALLMCETSHEDISERLDGLGLAFAEAARESSIVVPTVSFGVSVAMGGVPVEISLARADAAMYEAKAAGRNRVVLDLEPVDSSRRGE